MNNYNPYQKTEPLVNRCNLYKRAQPLKSSQPAPIQLIIATNQTLFIANTLHSKYLTTQENYIKQIINNKYYELLVALHQIDIGNCLVRNVNDNFVSVEVKTILGIITSSPAPATFTTSDHCKAWFTSWVILLHCSSWLMGLYLWEQ